MPAGKGQMLRKSESPEGNQPTESEKIVILPKLANFPWCPGG